MPMFRKKPVVIEAIQSDGTPESNREIIDWTRGSATPAHMGDTDGDHQTLYISTLEGEHRVTVGDYVIRGVKGEHYPCKPDIFEATYEPAQIEPDVKADPAQADSVWLDHARAL